eukprot:jgi/Mesvir1/26679/Mv20461-RA.1
MARKSAPAGPSQPTQNTDEEDEQELTQEAAELTTEQLVEKYSREAAEASEMNVARILTPEERDKLVGDIIRFMLFRHYAGAAPATRDDMNKVVMKHYESNKGHRGLLSYLLPLAQERMIRTLGLELREITRTVQEKASKASQRAPGEAAPSSKQYVLRSTLPADVREHYVDTPAMKAAAGFKMLVLGLIHLRKDKGLEEESLRLHLADMGVHLDDKREDHPVLGNIPAQLAALVKQRYIREDKDEEKRKIYFLGDNALDEIPAHRLEEFVMTNFSI